MSYFTNERLTGSAVSSGRSWNQAEYSFVNAPTAYDCVYSWRSGRGKSSSKMLSPDVDSSEGSTLTDRINARQEAIQGYLDEVSMSAQGNAENFLTEDIGHSFGVLHAKTRVGSGSVEYRTRYDSSNRYWDRFDNPVPVGASRLYANGSVIHDTVGAYIPDFGTWFRSRGATLPNPNTSTNPSTLLPNGLDQAGHSTRLISAANPFDNQANFLATAVELLRGDIPKFVGNLRMHANEIRKLKVRFKTLKQASEYLGGQSLNVQFGWAPIIRDIGAGIELLLSVDRAMFPTDDTRRRREAPLLSIGADDQRTLEWGIVPHLTDRYNGFPVAGSRAVNSIVGPGFHRRVTINTDVTIRATADIRLTAKFRTGLKPTSANNGYVDQALTLMGLKLTPEVVWELTPWTWMIDWFANIGTIVSNVSTLGYTNAILNYAYSTLRYRATTSYVGRRPGILVPPTSAGFSDWSGNILFQEEYDMKVRMAASPFGFSVATPDLSVGQWGILASLGLARSR